MRPCSCWRDRHACGGRCFGIGDTLVTQRIELTSNDECRGQAFKFAAERRSARIRAVSGRAVDVPEPVHQRARQEVARRIFVVGWAIECAVPGGIPKVDLISGGTADRAPTGRIATGRLTGTENQTCSPSLRRKARIASEVTAAGIGIAVARGGVEHTPGHINGGRGPDPGARGSEELNAELVPPHRFWYLGDAEALPQHLAGGGVQGSDAAAKAAWVVRICTLRETPTNRICPPWRPRRCRESREILQS
jgi:hypothetical protein